MHFHRTAKRMRLYLCNAITRAIVFSEIYGILCKHQLTRVEEHSIDVTCRKSQKLYWHTHQRNNKWRPNSILLFSGWPAS